MGGILMWRILNLQRPHLRIAKPSWHEIQCSPTRSLNRLLYGCKCTLTLRWQGAIESWAFKGSSKDVTINLQRVQPRSIVRAEGEEKPGWWVLWYKWLWCGKAGAASELREYQSVLPGTEYRPICSGSSWWEVGNWSGPHWRERWSNGSRQCRL